MPFLITKATFLSISEKETLNGRLHILVSWNFDFCVYFDQPLELKQQYCSNLSHHIKECQKHIYSLNFIISWHNLIS